MSLPDDGNVTIAVIQMEPGWIYVKVAGPRPEPQGAELLLRKTIEDWFEHRPHLSVSSMEAVTDNGEIQGINVWFSGAIDRAEPGEKPPARRPGLLKFEVHHLIHDRVKKEHWEAIFDEAAHHWLGKKAWFGTMVAINPRRIAVVLDSREYRGAILPVEMVFPRIDDEGRRRALAWLERPSTRLHWVLLPGSWFGPQPVESRRIESPRTAVWDSIGLLTNMTYDSGPRD